MQSQDNLNAVTSVFHSILTIIADSLPKTGPSKQTRIPTRTSIPTTRASDHSDAQPMDTEHYGPPLPPQSTQSIQFEHASKHSDVESNHSDHYSKSEQPKRVCSKAKKHSDKRKHKVWAKYYSQSSSSEEDESSAPIKKSTKPQQKAPPEPEHHDSTGPVFYREVDMSDFPSQYAEEVETFRQILDLPDPRETLPRSSTTVLGMDEEKGQEELRPRGPSAMLPLNPILVSPRNSKSKLSIGVGTSGNRRHRILVILARKMILTDWGTMWRRFLALKQTLRVLLKICFLYLPIPNPYILNLYH